MYSYYTTTYLSKTIHIIKGQEDANENIQLSILADRYDSGDPLKLASEFSDSYLEANGWSKVGVINGGLFFSGQFASGIEKAFWTVNENDDAWLDDVMGLAHNGNDSNLPIVETQGLIKSNWGGYRGGFTGAFGLLRNGVVDQGNTSSQGSYSSLSGRAIVGDDSSGAIYFIAVAGVTGSSGLTGAQCLSLAQSLGLRNAVAMDGGGSVSLIYQGSWKVSTTREIKNVVAMYAKAKTIVPPDPGGGGTTTDINKLDQYTPSYEDAMPHQIYFNGVLTTIEDIKIMTNGTLVSIADLESI